MTTLPNISRVPDLKRVTLSGRQLKGIERTIEELRDEVIKLREDLQSVANHKAKLCCVTGKVIPDSFELHIGGKVYSHEGLSNLAEDEECDEWNMDSPRSFLCAQAIMLWLRRCRISFVEPWSKEDWHKSIWPFCHLWEAYGGRFAPLEEWPKQSHDTPAYRLMRVRRHY